MTRVGVVGGGLIAQLAHLPLLRCDDRFRLTALAEPAGDVREALQARHAIPAVFGDHRAMLASGVADAVIVCSPNETHAEVAIDAIEAGCSVLIEKPLCLAPADGHAVLEAARKRGAVAQVAYMKQFDAAVGRFMRSLPSSDLERVDSVTVDNAIGRRYAPSDLVAAGASEPHPDPTDERAYSLAFCGALIHDVNLVLNVLDRLAVRVVEVTGAAASRDATSASCECRLSNGARWTASWRLEPDAPGFSEQLRFTFAEGPRTLSLPVPYDDVAAVYDPQLRHFATRIRSGDASTRSIEEGIRDVALMAEARRRLPARAEAMTA